VHVPNCGCNLVSHSDSTAGLDLTEASSYFLLPPQVTAGLQDFPFTVAGDPELTRLAAEQSAARKMLGHIEIDQ